MFRQIQFAIRSTVQTSNKNYVLQVQSRSFATSTRLLAAKPIKPLKPRKRATTPVGKHDNSEVKPITDKTTEQGPVSGSVSTSQMKKPSGPKGPIPQNYSRATVSEDIELVNHELGWKNAKTGEFGGPKGLEPTRFGDWEHKGRISDF